MLGATFLEKIHLIKGNPLHFHEYFRLEKKGFGDLKHLFRLTFSESEKFSEKTKFQKYVLMFQVGKSGLMSTPSSYW